MIVEPELKQAYEQIRLESGDYLDDFLYAIAIYIVRLFKSQPAPENQEDDLIAAKMIVDHTLHKMIDKRVQVDINRTHGW